MATMILKDYTEAVLAVLFVGVGGISMGWFKILKETNILLKEQNAELKADNKAWQKKHSDNEKAIADLQGQLNMLKELPLKRIDESLASINLSNKEILNTLKNSAITLIKETSDVASHVREVKSDLEHSK